jgi:F-type H+-transporting ATPase subunit delta
VPRANRQVWEAVGARLDELGGSAALEPVVRSLLDIAALFGREPRLRSFVTDPNVPAGSRGDLLRSLLAGQVDPASIDIVVIVAEHQRLQPREIVEVLEEVAAQVLFDMADADGSLQDVEDELLRFTRLADGDPGLRSALTDPALPGDNKRALVEDLLEVKANRLTVLLLGSLVQRYGGRELTRTVEDAIALASERRRRVVAEVRSAVDLDAERRGRLAEALERVAGRSVDLHVIVDPAVLGALSVRIGDEVYDGTVRHQLERARERLGVG